jgi:hypothetical protein
MLGMDDFLTTVVMCSCQQASQKFGLMIAGRKDKIVP